jgi:hypothetical protein
MFDQLKLRSKGCVALVHHCTENEVSALKLTVRISFHVGLVIILRSALCPA